MTKPKTTNEIIEEVLSNYEFPTHDEKIMRKAITLALQLQNQSQKVNKTSVDKKESHQQSLRKSTSEQIGGSPSDTNSQRIYSQQDVETRGAHSNSLADTLSSIKKEIEILLEKGKIKDTWGYDIIQGDLDGLKLEISRIFEKYGVGK